MPSRSPLPSPDDIKARIDALVAKADLAQLWGVYYARQVGGEAGEELLTDLFDRGEDAVRGLKEAPQLVDSLRRTAQPLTRDLVSDLKQVITAAEGRADKVQDVVTGVRGLWPAYSDEVRQWFTTNWPDARPDGPAAADVELPDLEK